MYRCSVIPQLRHARLFAAALVAGAVGLAFVPTAHAQEVEVGSKDLNECFFAGAPHGRKIGSVWYDNVRVIYQELKHPRAGFGPRPIQVVAVIIPGHYVGTRQPTPEPSSGFHTGDLPDVDKGHVIALQLGGPNNALNVVPQWAHWQRLEEWRAMERALEKQAKRIADQSRPVGGLPTRSILMNVAIEYKDTGTLVRRVAWSFPSAFYVTACIVNIADPDHNCIQGIPYILNNHKFEGGPPHN